jgi:type VI secretion system protein ImpL
MKAFFTKIFSVFKKAWFWWLLGLIALVCITWFALPLLKFGSAQPFASKALRLAIILVWVIAWAIINIVLARRAGEDDDEDADPEKVARALELLDVNFSKACDVMSKDSWGERIFKREAYALPWYLTLGAPQSGRSSLLKNSGLPYPVANESYQQLDQAEDELCQFWFSKSAVIIDTHDELLTETKENSVAQRVYGELLTLLKRYRRRQPLNGVVLCLDVAELLAQNEQQRATTAHLWRTQLQTLNSRLGIQCPIYVTFTKIDKLSGFDEFFSALTSEQQQQALGFTFELRKKDSITQFDAAYDALVKRLELYSVNAVLNSADSREAALSYNFPTQLRSIKTTLQDFLAAVFESNHYQQPHAVRGVFFTSSLQGGVPFNGLQQASEKNYGIEVVNEQEKQGRKALFIAGLFKQVMFREKGVLLFDALQQKRQFAWRCFAFGFAGLISLLFLYLFANSFMLNKEQLNVVDQSVIDFQSIPASLKAKNSRLISVLPMLNELYEMRAAFSPEVDPRAMRWGMYQGYKIDSVAEEIYRQNLAIYFTPYVVDAAVGQLQQKELKPNHRYNALRVYLMLANPDKLNADFLQNYLYSFWAKKYADKPSVVASLANNLAAFVSMPIKPITIDKNLVEKSRAALRHTTQAQRDYFELQELAMVAKGSHLYISSGLNLGFNIVFGSDDSDLNVPALYSKKGFTNLYKVQLQKVLENDGFSSWVLGDYAKKSLADEGDNSNVAEQVRNFYMQDYISEWAQVLEGLDITKFSTLKQAGTFLSTIAGGSSPLYEVLNTVKANTELNPEANGSSGFAGAQKFLKNNKKLLKAVQPKALKKVTGKARKFKPKGGKKKGSVAALENPLEQTPVGKHFTKLNTFMQGGQGKEAESGLDKIMQALDALNVYIGNINSARNSNERAYKAVLAHIEGGEAADPLTQLMVQAKAAPQPVQRWLTNVANYTWAAMLSGASDYIAQQYSAKLLPEYNAVVNNQYPFYPDAKTEVGLGEFSQFFEPNGKFDTFFNAYLKPFIDTDKPVWQWKPIEGQTLPLSDGFLKQLQRANNIQQAFFTEEGKPAAVNYKLQVESLSAYLTSAQLSLNGQSLSYRHGPKRTVDFNWPREGGQNRYALTLTDLAGRSQTYSGKGAWGSFKLFSQGKMASKPRSSAVSVSFSSKSRAVRYELSVDGAINPFAADLLPAFRLPAKLETK